MVISLETPLMNRLTLVSIVALAFCACPSGPASVDSGISPLIFNARIRGGGYCISNAGDLLRSQPVSAGGGHA